MSKKFHSCKNINRFNIKNKLNPRQFFKKFRAIREGFKGWTYNNNRDMIVMKVSSIISIPHL